MHAFSASESVQAPQPLALRNGYSAPSGDIPLFTLDVFTHWLSGSVRGGGRVVAFFALPRTEAPLEPSASGQTAEKNDSTVLLAIVARDDKGTLELAKTLVAGEYPSLTGRFPEMHLFERDLYERHGVEPAGHPWLKPVRFPHEEGPEVGMADFYRIAGEETHEVAVGPIHAGVIECGHFRFQCLGELVMHLEISLGYHHRGALDLVRGGVPGPRTLGLMEALSGDSSVAHTWAYCALVEALGGTPASPRGELIRALALELERLANHTGDLGALAGDTGFLPTMSYCGRLRGDWLNMSALLCGSRFGRGLLHPGGTRFDLDAAMAQELARRIRQTVRDVRGAVQLIWDSPSVMARLTGVGAVSQGQAWRVGMVGMAARASGLARDVRHSHPLPDLPAPPQLQVVDAHNGQGGDVLARAGIRNQEISASADFCLRLLDILRDSEEKKDSGAVPASARAAVLPGLRPNRIAVALTEGWRGEVCHTALTDGQGAFAVYEVIDPSFHNWLGLALAMREQQISDFPLCNKSFNLSYCGHDL